MHTDRAWIIVLEMAGLFILYFFALISELAIATNPNIAGKNTLGLFIAFLLFKQRKQISLLYKLYKLLYNIYTIYIFIQYILYKLYKHLCFKLCIYQYQETADR